MGLIEYVIVTNLSDAGNQYPQRDNIWAFHTAPVHLKYMISAIMFNAHRFVRFKNMNGLMIHQLNLFLLLGARFLDSGILSVIAPR